MTTFVSILCAQTLFTPITEIYRMCSNTPAGVAVLQGKFKGNIINHFSHANGRLIILLAEVDRFQTVYIIYYPYRMFFRHVASHLCVQSDVILNVRFV